MKRIDISLKQSSYNYSVDIGSGILESKIKNVLLNYQETKIFIVTSETIHSLYPNVPNKYLPASLKAEMLILPDGEKTKNLATIEKILDFLMAKQANRKSILIAFGGGVIGDMVGFAAAIFMRGIPFIQIPTTLLSQVDSGIGGKTGVNHPDGKNMIGAFKQPLRTIIDIDLLKTLSRREFVAGYAELIKHGFIRDKNLFDLLSKVSVDELRENNALLTDAIYRSCLVKADVVEQDEKEAGLRAILNFGHTLGHFLETITEYKLMLHGEAVIIGMDFAAWWSQKRHELPLNQFQEIHNCLKKLGVSHAIKEVDKKEFVSVIAHDKKSMAQGIRFVGLKTLGEATLYDKTKPSDIWEDYQEYLKQDPLLTI